MLKKKNTKEKVMMRPQRSVSTWSLSKICQALMGLGVFKIAIFTALGFGYTLPDITEMSFVDTLVSKYEQLAHTPEHTQKTDATPVAEVATPTYNATVKEAPKVDPQGSAAVRAALAYRADPRRQFSDTIPHAVTMTPQAPVEEPVAAAPRAQEPQKEDISWWDNLSALTQLPIPRLGVDQVAYAATLDTPLAQPPAPAPRTGTSTPFTPPAQVLPAGVAGPKTSPQTGLSATESLLVPNTNPPAPKLDAYIPPEDPNRKEQELARREQEILMLQKQMEQRLEELQSAERKVQGMLKEAKDVEASKVNNLTNMYVNMKPRQAGAALESLDEGIAAKILISMRSKQAGEILSYMNPAKTAQLTELLSRMRLQQ